MSKCRVLSTIIWAVYQNGKQVFFLFSLIINHNFPKILRYEELCEYHNTSWGPLSIRNTIVQLASCMIDNTRATILLFLHDDVEPPSAILCISPWRRSFWFRVIFESTVNNSIFQSWIALSTIVIYWSTHGGTKIQF